MVKYIKTEDELTHWGVLGMKWGVRKDSSKGSASKRGPNKKAGVKPKNEVKVESKNTKKLLKEQNDERILKEINEYSKKTGKAYATKFLETYDDLEMWDLYSPEELDLFNDLESSGGFDEYKSR